MTVTVSWFPGHKHLFDPISSHQFFKFASEVQALLLVATCFPSNATSRERQTQMKNKTNHAVSATPDPTLFSFISNCDKCKHFAFIQPIFCNKCFCHSHVQNESASCLAITSLLHNHNISIPVSPTSVNHPFPMPKPRNELWPNNGTHRPE